MLQSESPRAPLEPVRVLSVPEGIPIVVRFLADVVGLDTHWKSGRTIPCPGVEECAPTVHRLGVIWRGYSPVEAWEASKGVWRPWVLEVTEALEERLRGRFLRGETWSLHRTEQKGRTSAVIGVYCEKTAPDEVRPAFEVEPVLRRIFHCGSLRLGTRNPLPPKIMLEALPGKAPTLPADLAQAGTGNEEAKDREQAFEMWKRFRSREGAHNGQMPGEKNGKQH